MVNGVAAINGRLQFDDVPAYVQFLEAATTQTEAERVLWETQRGFTSLLTAMSDTTRRGAARGVGEELRTGDLVAASFLNPSGVVGIGDRTYDIEGNVIKGYDLDGVLVGTEPAYLAPPPCEPDNLSDECGTEPGPGGPGGTGTGTQPDAPTVNKIYGPETYQETRTLNRYRLDGSIFRTHIFIFSSIGADLYNNLLKDSWLQGYHYDKLYFVNGRLECKAKYIDGTRTFFERKVDDVVFHSDGTAHLWRYFDFDVFDFTGTGSLRRIECSATGESNRRSLGTQYANDPTFPGDLRMSRNF